MNFPNTLIVGAALWVLSELLEIVQGGFTLLNSSVSGAAFVGVAVGIWALWPKIAGHRVGQVGVVAISLGMALFTIVVVQTIMIGAQNDLELSSTPLYLSAGTAVSVGALALGYWLMRVSPFPASLGVLLLGATAFTLVVAFVPSLVELQAWSNIVLASVLGRLGLALRSQENS